MYPIASTTMTTAGTALFANIPQNFSHLQLRVSSYVSFSSATIQGMVLSIYDTTATLMTPYYSHFLYGNGSTVTSTTGSGSASPAQGYGTSGTNLVYSAAIIDILDYTNTNKTKTVKGLYGFDLNGSGTCGVNSMAVFSTSAIGQLAVNYGGYLLGAGSRLDLYGISTSNTTGA
jgi:hypothetical protein